MFPLPNSSQFARAHLLFWELPH